MFSFLIGGFQVANGNVSKCLGLIMDRKINWRLHIDHVSKICYMQIRALYTIRDLFGKEQLRLLCMSFVYSVMSYMMPVYGVAKNIHLQLISKIIKTLSRMILMLWFGMVAS